MKFKLSPLFMMTVMAVAAAIPLTLGVGPEVLMGAVGVVAASAFLVEYGPSSKRAAFGQLGEIGAGNIEQEYKEVKASLKAVNDDLKRYAEESQRELKSHAKMTEETRAKVDELLTAQGELRANLQAAEQTIAKLEQGGGHVARPKSAGELVTESDQYKAFAASGRGSVKVGIQAAVTSDTSSAGDLIEPQRVPGIVAPPQQRLFLRDLLNWGRTTSNSIEYVKETGFTNSADVVSENPANPKPESDLQFDLESAPVATIAHWIQASRQVLADASMLQSYINGRLMYGLKYKEELQLLKGSGVNLNIEGIYTQASSYSNPGVTVQAETAIDRLRLALLQVTLAEYDADGIVLNPVDWAAIELTKTTDNAYLFATPRGLAAPGLWGRPVVATQAMDVGDFLTGSFQMGAQGWDREDASVTISLEDRDNFVKNMVTILCEERVGLTVYRPEAFVKGDFDGLPASA